MLYSSYGQRVIELFPMCRGLYTGGMAIGCLVKTTACEAFSPIVLNYRTISGSLWMAAQGALAAIHCKHTTDIYRLVFACVV